MVCFPVHAVIKAYKLIAYPTTCELLRALGLPKPSPPVTGNGIHHVFPPSREGGDVDRIAGSASLEVMEKPTDQIGREVGSDQVSAQTQKKVCGEVQPLKTSH